MRQTIYFDDGSTLNLVERQEAALPPSPQWFRVPSDIERMNYDERDLRRRLDGTRGPVRGVVLYGGKRMPQIYRIFPRTHTVLYDDCIRLWRYINPDLSAQKFSTLMGSRLAWMNGTGCPPRRNVILGQDLNADFPAWDQNRIMAGASIKGEVRDGKVYFNYIKNVGPMPAPNDVLRDRSLWHYAVSVSPDGVSHTILRESKTGILIPVRIPHIYGAQPWIPLIELQPWEEMPLASPTWQPY